MAQGKKSFLLYCDILATVKKLSREQRGDLFTLILEYVNDMDPETNDLLMEIAFEPIKQQLKRDLKRYEGIVESRRNAGLASANKRQQVSTSVEQNQQVSTKATDSVTVIDNDTDIDKEVKSEVKTSHPPKSLEYRELDFRKDVFDIGKEKYTEPMLEAFTNFWTQANPNGKKMHFEKQGTFEISRRLATWAAKDYNNQTNRTNGNKKTSGLSTEAEQREFLEAVASGIARAKLERNNSLQR